MSSSSGLLTAPPTTHFPIAPSPRSQQSNNLHMLSPTTATATSLNTTITTSSPATTTARRPVRDTSPGPFIHDVRNVTTGQILTPGHPSTGRSNSRSPSRTPLDGSSSSGHRSRSRAFKNREGITILSPRAISSTVQGVVQSPNSSGSVTSPVTSPNSANSGITQRIRPTTTTVPPNGYSYTPKVRPSHQTRTSPATAVSITNRYNFHAANLIERAATDSINYAADSYGLNPIAMAAFSAASLPASASHSLSHFSSHPVTFSSQPGERILGFVAPNSSGRTGSPPNAYQYPHQRTAPSAPPNNANHLLAQLQSPPSSTAAPALQPFFDPVSGIQLPPLTSYRPASKDVLAAFAPPALKHDRAVQTEPVATITSSLTNTASSAAPSAVLSSGQVIPGSSTSSSLPAAAQSGRRPGYELTHHRLLQMHHPDIFADITDDLLKFDTLSLDLSSVSVKEEESKTQTHSRELTPTSLVDPKSPIHSSTSHSSQLVHQSSPTDSYDLNWFEESLSGFYRSLTNWDEFDIFQLYDLTNGWPLSFLFMMIDKRHHFLEANNIDPVTAFHFIQEVESNYLPNPYHTATHAADVLHAAFHLVEHTPVLKNGLSSLDCLVLYISCAIHDFQHPGVNNSFLVNSRAPLALRYNDRSVLESFHVSSAFRMMHYQPHCNILGGFPFQEYSKIRKTLIDLVLSTDLAVHFELMGVFKRRLQQSQADLMASVEDRLMIMQIILKCGDLSHPARSRRLHLKWSELVTEEFFLQGDREKILNLPPSMFMDRHTTNLAQSQIGFITFLVYPMFQAYYTFSIHDYWSKKVELNLEWWHEVARVETEEKKMEAERIERGLDPDSESNAGDENSTVSEPNSSSTASAGSSHVTSRRTSVDEIRSISQSQSSNTSPTNKDSKSTTEGTPSKTVSFSETATEVPASSTSSTDTTAAEPDDTIASSPRANKIVVMPLVNTTPNASFNATASNSPATAGAPFSSTRKRNQRRSQKISASSVTEDLALLSETAQVAALSAAGASATEAKEHQEEEQAQQQAANAAAAAAAAATPTTSTNATSTPTSGNTLGLGLLNNLPLSKRKSVMTGVAPPASPLVLQRATSKSMNGVKEEESLPTPNSSHTGSQRSLGLALSERRALSLTIAAGSTSANNSPLQSAMSTAKRTSITSIGDSPSTRGSVANVLSDSMFEKALLIAKQQAESASLSPEQRQQLPKQLTHMEQLELSHGGIYAEVRELASLTAVELSAASLTAPVPTLSPSHAAPHVIPLFSKKAHALLNAKARPKEPTATTTPTTTTTATATPTKK